MNPHEGADTQEKRILAMAAEKRLPVSGSIEVSPLCNMDCAMCYVRLSPEELKAKGRLRTADEWLAVGREMRDAGVLFLLLTGGEPLLYPEFKELYLGLRRLGMILTINTNGTLLGEAWADFFAENPPRRINLTIYGGNDDAYRTLCRHPDGYAKAMRAAALLKERGIQFRFSYSVTKENAADLVPFMKEAREMGVHSGINPYMIPAVRERTQPFDDTSRVSPEEAAKASFAIMREAVKDEEELKSRCKEKTDRIDQAAAYFAAHPELEVPSPSLCMGGRCSFSVSWQGELHPCVILTAPSASVFDTSFAEAWKRVAEGAEKLRLPAKCTACPRRSVCEICPAAALTETGSMEEAPAYLCRFSEELERLYREALRA